MKIYTKTGDAGTTMLASGERVDKYCLRVSAYGMVDELNSNIGYLISLLPESCAEYAEQLTAVQNSLFSLGGVLSSTKQFDITEVFTAKVEEMESWIDRISETLPTWKGFILPGGSQPAAFAHICRTVCRRAEREACALAKTEQVDDLLIIYLNRLSDYLFMLSQRLNAEMVVEEKYWKK